jgi:hypothetical protein
VPVTAEAATANLQAAGRTTSPLPLRTRAAIGSLLACVAFLVVYGVLHALHLCRLDPPPLAQLSSIPLFATFCGSAMVAIAVGLLPALGVAGGRRFARRLPGILLVAFLGLAVEIILFP